MQSIQTLYPLLRNDTRKQPLSIVITMHAKPDADALGSSLALLGVLKKRGHQVGIVSPTNWGYYLNALPYMEELIDAEKKTETAQKIFQEANFIFALDFNTWERTHIIAQWIPNLQAKKVLIDHHQKPDFENFDYGISSPKSSSTSEMVFDFINDIGLMEDMDRDVASCIYAGILGDTGSFKFSITPDLHRKVAILLEKNIPYTKIYRTLFDTNTELKLKFIGHLLTNRLTIHSTLPVAVLYITKEDISTYQIKTGDTEGLVDYPMSLKNIQLVAMFSDREVETRCSFRGKNEKFDLSQFAEKYFSGGGHKMAAGGRSKDTLQNTVQKFWNVIEIYKEIFMK